MGLVLATEGKSRQNVTHITSQEYVEGIGVGAGASNDGKRVVLNCFVLCLAYTRCAPGVRQVCARCAPGVHQAWRRWLSVFQINVLKLAGEVSEWVLQYSRDESETPDSLPRTSTPLVVSNSLAKHHCQSRP